MVRAGAAAPASHYPGFRGRAHGVWVRYLPRQDGKLNGTIVGYEVYVCLDRNTWVATPWMRGSWDTTAAAKIEVWSNGQRGRYLKLVATSAADNRPWTSVAEIQIIGEFP